MATHSSMLAWEIPWTEEPSGLQSAGFKESDTTEHAYKQACTRLKNEEYRLYLYLPSCYIYKCKVFSDF